MTRLTPVPLQLLTIRQWLGCGLVVLCASTSLEAQAPPKPDLNLFGDEIVKKLNTRDGVIMHPVNTEEAQSAPVLQGFAHILTFQDGTQIRGDLVGLTKDEVMWSRPDIDEPLRFRRDATREIVLSQSPDRGRARRTVRIFSNQDAPDDPAKAGFTTVKLSGGDWLHGELSSTDGQNFSLKTGTQTSFALKRDSISWLHSGAIPAPAFGFTGRLLDMAGWLERTPGAQMEVKEGTLVVKGSDWIGRTISSIRRFELSFELPQDAEENTRIWLQPFGAEVNSYSTGTIEMRLSRSIFQHTIFANRMDTTSTPLPKEATELNGPVRYRICYDGPGERLAVFRNGQQLGEWKFIDEKNKAQNPNFNREFHVTGICFQRQPRRGDESLKLNKLQIQPWDGSLSPDESAVSEGDSLLSQEGKQRAGRVESLSKEELTFSGEKLKWKTGTILQFANEPIPLANADTVLQFGDLGELSASELQISEGKARFNSVIAPAQEVPIENLQTITFHQGSKPAQPKSSDIIVFKNGDELPGFLVSAAKGSPWRWQTVDGQEFGIKSDRIAGFRSIVGSTVANQEQKKMPAIAEFRNGDRLRGELTGFNEGRIQFRHESLGSFEWDHALLWSLFPNQNTQVLDGGQNPSKWMTQLNQRDSDSPEAERGFNSDQWLYLDGHYILRPEINNLNGLRTGLSNTLKEVPERFEFRCDVTNASGGEPNVSITIAASQNGGNIQASLSYGRLHAHTFSRKARGSRSRQVSFADKIPDPTSRRNIRMFVDSKVGTVDIFVDGVFLTRLGQQEAERVPGLGKGFHLYPYSTEGTFIVSNLWIGPWNGELPKAGAGSEPATSLTNGDVVTGAPKDFRAGKLVLDSEVGLLEVPVDKILSVEFGGAMSQKQPAARIRLSDSCSISFEDFRWEGSQFVGQSEVLGDLRIPVNLISELALSPLPPRAPKNPPVKQVASREPNKLEELDGE